MKKLKQEKAITLIALVITIIVLLILAGVTIATLAGENGILAQASKAVERTKEAEKKEEQMLYNVENYMKTSIVSDGSFNSKKGVNTPKLGIGMTAVTFDENIQNEDGTKGGWREAKNEDEWYSYTEKDKKWANAMTEDGSMWVWIPRFAYQIESGYNQNGKTINSEHPEQGFGDINIKFLKGTTDIAADGKADWNNESGEGNWNIHPVFQNGNDNNYINGEWKEELSGIWVAKFEASRSDAGTTDSQNTKVTEGTLKIKPSVNSWKNITVGEAYEKSLTYNPTLNSHLMKDSEYGACIYFSHSSYGIGKILYRNSCSNGITGAGPKIGADTTSDTYEFDEETFYTQYSYTTEQGQKASSTGNVYGIYDLSGGLWEKTASYIDNNNANLQINAKSIIDGQPYTKNVYKVGNTDTKADNYQANKHIYGNAIFETSSSGVGDNTWEMAESEFLYGSNVLMDRGGACNYALPGKFSFSCWIGGSHWSAGFRPILCIE